MVTCSICGNLHVKCDTSAWGMNLHTKVQEGNRVLVSPEFFVVKDDGKNPVIDCECGKMDLRFFCDYCGNAIRGKTVYMVKQKNGKVLMADREHSENLPEGWEATPVKISDIELIPNI